MNRIIRNVVFILTIAVSSQSFAVEPIKVLLANSNGASSVIAAGMLNQIATLLENSDINDREFVNANGANPVHVESAPLCTGINHETLLECAETTFEETKRDLYDADIVVMLVPSLAPPNFGQVRCGAVPDLAINPYYIGSGNRIVGYAVVSSQCMLVEGWFPASHEVLHLMYVEHKKNDEHENRPAGAEEKNHAASSGQYATAGAAFGDCQPAHTICTEFENVMSEDGKFFSSGTQFPRGNSSHSDAVSFVRNLSWSAVSAYRPEPAQSASCQLSATYVTSFCNNPNPILSTTAKIIGGPSVDNAVYDVLIGGGGGWSNIFDGILTCPVFSGVGATRIRALLQTALGIYQCEIPIPTESCGGPPPF